MTKRQTQYRIMNAEPGMDYLVRLASIGGCDDGATLSVEGALLSVNNGPFDELPVSVKKGDQVAVRMTSSHRGQDPVQAVVNIDRQPITLLVVAGGIDTHPPPK